MPINTTADLLSGQLYYPGQIISAVGAQQAVIRTGINASASVIPFGYGVARGVSDGEILLPTNDTAVFMGVLMAVGIEKRAGYSLDDSNRFGIPSRHEAAIVEAGDIAVYVDGNVVEGGDVYWNVAASTSVPGAFRGAPNSNNTVQIVGARWLKTVTGGTPAAMRIAALRLNRP